MPRASQRGSYAKGEQKREEILDRAVEAFGKLGYHATSMREIASTCGLSQAGLLHYFPNKESLLLALVERREADQDRREETPDVEVWIDRILLQESVNEKEKALTQLWANLVGEATDPSFPAHKYFVERYKKTRKNISSQIASVYGRENPTEEDKLKAAVVVAMWDGLQTQWLLDPKFDMRRTFEYGLTMIARYSQYK